MGDGGGLGHRILLLGRATRAAMPMSGRSSDLSPGCQTPSHPMVKGSGCTCVFARFIGKTRGCLTRKRDSQQRDCTGLSPVSLLMALWLPVIRPIASGRRCGQWPTVHSGKGTKTFGQVRTFLHIFPRRPFLSDNKKATNHHYLPAIRFVIKKFNYLCGV